MKRITRKWKRRLYEGLSVFTTDQKSVTHQKRLIRGEKDFASGLVSGLSEEEALEKAFNNAAGGTNAKYDAALAAAYKASPPAKDNKWDKWEIVILVLVAASLIFLISSDIHKKVSDDVTKNNTTHTTWQMATGDYGNNRWFADGIAEIQNAKTDAEAREATYIWVDNVKRDPNLLVGAVKVILEKDVDSTTLSTNDDWATDKAVQLALELELTLGRAKISSAAAPADGYNSGVENNTVVGATNAGITGNRQAVQIDLSDGKTVWVMARCGNIVTPSAPTFPPGKTDEKPIVIVTPPKVVPPPTIVIVTPPKVVPPPTVTEEYLTPKSSDPDDYKSPGDDNKRDSGEGDKPIIEKVTTRAESNPPEVDERVTNDITDIVDKVTNEPKEETGVTAPDAEEPNEERSPEEIPDIEKEVNSDEGGNAEEIDNPF